MPAVRPPAVLMVLALTGAACTNGSSTPTAAERSGVVVRVEQPKERTVYWVLPGKRRLDPEVFGTPSQPLRTGEERIASAEGATKALLQRLPLLVGIPLPARETDGSGERFTTTKEPVPVGDEGRIVPGRLRVTYRDRQPYDLPGDPFDTADEVDATAEFNDPSGSEYEIVVRRLFQPPIPDWDTGGGVVTGSWIHGATGTDSPLFPTAFTYGALWGVGDVVVNGETVDRDKWVHFMTTQTVRNRDFRLAVNADLPLAPADTIAGSVHHTHVIVRPIRIAADGTMTFDPVKTAFMLPNGQPQPYLHLMFEQESIAEGPFADWAPAPAGPARTGEAAPAAARTVTVTADEFSFAPTEIPVRKGEPVTILLRNEGTIAHNIGIDELDARSETVPPGESTRLTFTPTIDGSFTFYCHVPGHRQAGMQGTLRISA